MYTWHPSKWILATFENWILEQFLWYFQRRHRCWPIQIIIVNNLSYSGVNLFHDFPRCIMIIHLKPSILKFFAFMQCHNKIIKKHKGFIIPPGWVTQHCSFQKLISVIYFDVVTTTSLTAHESEPTRTKPTLNFVKEYVRCICWNIQEFLCIVIVCLRRGNNLTQNFTTIQDQNEKQFIKANHVHTSNKLLGTTTFKVLALQPFWLLTYLKEL